MGGQEGPGRQLCLLSSAPEGDRQNSSQDTESCPESHWKPRRRRLRNSQAGGKGGALCGGGAGADKTALGLKPGSGLQTQSAVAAGPQTPGTKRRRF